MKIYAIAQNQHQCYGHGDYGTDLSIHLQSGYDGAKTQPFYSTRAAALQAVKGEGIVIEITESGWTKLN